MHICGRNANTNENKQDPKIPNLMLSLFNYLSHLIL